MARPFPTYCAIACLAFFSAPTPAEDSPMCLDADTIVRYDIQSDQAIMLVDQNNDIFSLILDRSCPDLKFHNYLRLAPTNGALCAGRDSLLNRTGYRCEIAAIAKTESKRESLQIPRH